MFAEVDDIVIVIICCLNKRFVKESACLEGLGDILATFEPTDSNLALVGPSQGGCSSGIELC